MAGNNQTMPSSQDVLPPLDTDDKMLSGLCYPFWPVVPFFVIFSSKRSDPFLLFHALQGLASGVLLSVISVVGVLLMWVVFSALPTSYTMTSGVIGVFMVMTALLFGGLCFAFAIFLGWQASSGRFLRVPGLGDLCEARMALMLELSSGELEDMAVDRALVPDEKVVVLQEVSTPEQLSAEMDRWAQPVGNAGTWWGGAEAPTPQHQAVAPAAAPATPPPAAVEAPAWQSRPASAPRPQQRPAGQPSAPEVKPWKPAPANSGPQARPVSFPSVSRGQEAQRSEEQNPPKKWWKPE